MAFDTFLFAMDTRGKYLYVQGEMPFFRESVFTQGHGESFHAMTLGTLFVFGVSGNGDGVQGLMPDDGQIIARDGWLVLACDALRCDALRRSAGDDEDGEEERNKRYPGNRHMQYRRWNLQRECNDKIKGWDYKDALIRMEPKSRNQDRFVCGKRRRLW